MSKTYNIKHDFRQILDNSVDDYGNACIKATRHPNKRKNKVLGREFSDVGLTNPANWKYRFGDAYDRSNRTHLGRRELAAKRRNRLKHEVEEQITRELSDEQSI